MSNVITKSSQSLNNNDRIPQILRYLLYFYFFISFYEPFLNGILGSIMKYYIFLIMFLFLIYYRNFTIYPFHYAYIFWLAYKFISLMWTTDFWMFNATAVSQIGMVAWLICLTGVEMDSETLKGIVNSIAIGSLSVGVLSLFFSQSYHGRVDARQVLTIFGVQSEPNNQAAYIAIGFTIFLYRLFASNKHIIFNIIAVLINAFSVLKTGSRTGLVTLAFIAVIILLSFIRKKGITAVKGVLFAVAAIMCLYFITVKYLQVDTFERLFRFDTYEGGSNRDILWENALELYKKGLNPIFGAGWGAYFGYNGVEKSVHNTYIGMLCDVGIIGFLAFFVPIVNAIAKLWKRHEIIPICFFFSAAIPAFFIESINKRYFWNVVILLFVYYNRQIVKKKAEQKESTPYEI